MIPRLSLVALAAALAACAHAGAPAPAAPARLVLDGAVVRPHPDPLTGLTSYDPPLLLHLANEARRSGDLGRAVALYERLGVEFPASELALAATFGLGMAREDRHELVLAARAYEDAAGRDPGADEAARRIVIDAHFRLAGVLVAPADAWRAVAVFDRLLGRNDLSAFDRLQAVVGRGVALRRAGDDAAAEMAFVRALTLAEDGRGRGESDGGLAAEAALEWAEIATRRYDEVKLAFPVPALREALASKCEQLLVAQHRFLRAIRLGDGRIAAAAGFRVGWLYESLYEALTGLEVPPELTSEQREVYEQEVRARVSVLVKKAILVYERTLLVGRGSSDAGPWVQKLETALDRLRALYLDDPSRSAGATADRSRRGGA